MVYTLTYSSIHSADLDLTGSRAFFISSASKKDVDSCVFFVVVSSAFKKFVEFNSLNSSLKELFSKGLNEADFWVSLKDLFRASVFPDDVVSEIKESYEAVSISGDNLNNLLRSFEPRVNVFVSSDHDSGLSGCFLNIKGLNNVLSAIKSSWFNFFKSKGSNYLRNGFSFSGGVVVSKFLSCDYSVECFVSEESNLVLHAYKGLPDISGSIVKDSFVLSTSHLEFLDYSLVSQNFCVLHQDESGILLKKRLGKGGSDNKASKQIISECARLSKKCFNLIQEPLHVVFLIKNGSPLVFLINKLSESDNDSGEVFSKKKEEFINLDSVTPDFNKISKNNDDVSGDVNNDFVESSSELVSSDLFSDVDEFIVQDFPDDSKSLDVFSSFSELFSAVETKIFDKYKESFGFFPSSLKEGVFELDSKHGLNNKDLFLEIIRVKSLIDSEDGVGEEVILRLLSSARSSLNNFLGEVDWE